MPCPFVMPSQRERTLHFRIRSYYTRVLASAHFWDYILFTEACHSSSNETRLNRHVVVVHLHTFNITVEATRTFEMNKSIKQNQCAWFQVRRHAKSHITYDLPIVMIYRKLCHIHRQLMTNYADGCSPYEFSYTTEEVIIKLEKDANLLIEWYKNNYLKPNPKKWHLL